MTSQARIGRCLVVASIWASAGLAQQTEWYVVKDNPNAAAPFNAWSNAAATIQAAIDAVPSTPPADATVLVSNGVYDTGETYDDWPAGYNRVVINKPITVRAFSPNPADTVIKGQFHSGEPGQPDTVTNGANAVRCVQMFKNSTLIGFTLTNGATVTTAEGYGGGVYAHAASGSTNAQVWDCVIAGNAAHERGGGAGSVILRRCRLIGNSSPGGCGGAYLSLTEAYDCTFTRNTTGGIGGAGTGGTWYNCVLSDNTASRAGGAREATLRNCLIVGNTATTSQGGGTDGCTLWNCTVVSNHCAYDYGAGGCHGDAKINNCIIYYNTAKYYPNHRNISAANFTNTCTTPEQSGWPAGNITDPPKFRDAVNGIYLLQRDSPCIDAGAYQPWMDTGLDLHGRARICGSRVDMGAYEYYPAGVVIIVR